jgi:hypothetical protein
MVFADHFYEARTCLTLLLSILIPTAHMPSHCGSTLLGPLTLSLETP